MPYNEFESYTDLTSSLVDSSTERRALTGSDQNLNIDYNDFANHAVFGSAVSKLENFKLKVSEIEGYFATISSSFSGSGVALSGDSTVKKTTRKKLFNKVQNVIDAFTPYERFLYYDNQSQTTSSAPGLGLNLAHTIPVTGSFTTLTNYDGFNVVYKHTGSSNDYEGVNYFKGLYRAEEKPFFNYSGSLYLSFLLKPSSSISGLTLENRNANYSIETGKENLPFESLGSGLILSPSIIESEWRRFIFEASQSYWRPSRDGDQGSIGGSFDFGFGSGDYEILSQYEQIQLASGVPSGSYNYGIALQGEFYRSIGSVYTHSGVYFTGSLMPAGELFRISGSFAAGASPDADPLSYMTDIKITTKNPINVLPFSYLYRTGSSEWNDWYSGMHSSASSYDEANIHSFVNNFPKFIRNDPEATDLKTFTNMLGEQFDLTRNYIDNYQTFYKRRYNKLDSVPDNLLPILADSLGWEVIQPFTGSLAQYFGTSQQNIQVGGRTIEEITHNTWRKVLNNLIHVYKTKGTDAGVRALLNVYGYPADVMTLQELGGSTREHNPSTITDTFESLLEGMSGLSDNVSFVKFKDELYSWIFNNANARTLNFDWWTNSAANLETVEFILKPARSINDQIIFENSGSGTEKLWDLRLLTSASNHTYGQLEFRLNNTYSGSSVIGSNAVSMSTSYLPLKSGGELWNVMLQRMTSSISGTGIQEYKLSTGLQDGDKIKYFTSVSMSISGGTVNTYVTGGADTNFYANQNWLATGSLHYQSGSNLYVGKTYTGSLAEVRVWNTALSASKFKQHILNKKSTVGHAIDSSRNDISYRYALNENWNRGTASPKIKDSNPKNIKDFTINISTDLLTGSVLYDRSDIDIYKLSIRVGGTDQPNDNKIIINPFVDTVANLSPTVRSIKEIHEPNQFNEIKRRLSNKVQFVRSPQIILNEFIIDNLADFDISEKFADPKDLYESQYSELNKLRDNLFDHFDVTIDINKWIRAQANIFNQSSISAIQSVLPARTTVENIGVMFEPTLLDRNKAKYYEASIVTGSAAGYLNTEHDMLQYYDLDNSTYFDVKTNVIPIDISEDISLADSVQYASKNAEYNIVDLIGKSGDYIDVKNVEYDIESNITKEMSHIPTKNIEYNVESNIIKTISHQPSRNIEYDIESNIKKEILYQLPRNIEYSIADLIGKSGDYIDPKNIEYDVETNITKEISYIPTKNTEYNVESNITKTISYQPSRNIEYDIENTITKEISYESSKNVEYNVENNITKTISYQPSRNIEYDMEGSIEKTISYQPSRNIEYDMEGSIEKTISHQPSKNIEYDMEGSIKKSISHQPSRNIEYDMESSITKDMDLDLSQDSEYNINNMIIKEGNIEDTIEGEEPYMASQSYASFVNLADSWGTSSNDTQFLVPDSASKLSNIGYYEQDYVFSIVGDVETIVGQSETKPYDNNGINRLADYRNMAYDDEKFFANREVRDQGKGYEYKSYIKRKDLRTNASNFIGPQDGRPVGKTAYYVTKSNGDLVYPSNHWIHFSEDSLRMNFIKGTQNQGGQYMQLNEKVDHSKAAFYSIEVTGENILKVQRGRS